MSLTKWWPSLFSSLLTDEEIQCASQLNEAKATCVPATRVSTRFSAAQSLGRVPALRHHGLQHVRLPCPLPSPGAFSNSYPLSR